LAEQLFDAKGEIVSSGLHPGKGNTQIPLWERGSNVLFKDSSVKPGPRQSLIFNKPSGLLGNGIRSVNNEGSAALVWGNRKNLYRGTSIPIAIAATRASSLINALDNDFLNWAALPTTTVSDEGTIVAPDSTDSLKCEANAITSAIGAHRDLAAGATDFTGKVFSIWLYIDSNAYPNVNAGSGIRLRFSSQTAVTGDWDEFWLPRAVVPAADTWTKVELDLNVEVRDNFSGIFDITAVLSMQLLIEVELGLNFGSGDSVYWDEIEFSGTYTGTDLDRWSIVQFGQSVLASNGVDEVQYLANITTGLFQNLSDAGGDLPNTFRAKILGKLGPYIIAFNTDNDDTEARWCSEDDVLTWTPLASNSARDINIRDMNSSIKAVVEFGNSLLIVGITRAHIFQFLGPPFFFGAQKLIDGIGAVGKNAITEGGILIYGFSPHGIYITDGSTKQFIDQPDIHKFIFEGDNKYDKTRAELTCVWEDANDEEIYFSYPTIDGFGFTVSFNPALQVWSMHDYWRTAASPGELWRAPVLLSSTGDVWLQSDGGAGSSQDVNPLGLSDLTKVITGYGNPGYGENPYGGLDTID